MELKKIKKDSVWGTEASKLNDNFQAMDVEMQKLFSVTIKDAGVFATLKALQSARPTPNIGDTAKVGTELPYTIYVCEKAGVWKDSGATYTPTTQVPTVEQNTGESETSVMSQKAVTDALKKVGVKTTDGKTLQEVYEEAIVGKPIYAKSPFDINDSKWGNGSHPEWSLAVNKIDYTGECVGLFAKAHSDGIVDVIIVDSNNAKTNVVKSNIIISKGFNRIFFDKPINLALGQYIGFHTQTLPIPIIGRYDKYVADMAFYYSYNNYSTNSGGSCYYLITSYKESLDDKINEKAKSLEDKISEKVSIESFNNLSVINNGDEFVYGETSAINTSYLVSYEYGVVIGKKYPSKKYVKSLHVDTNYRGPARIGIFGNKDHTWKAEAIYEIEINDTENNLTQYHIILPANKALGLWIPRSAQLKVGGSPTSQTSYYCWKLGSKDLKIGDCTTTSGSRGAGLYFILDDSFVTTDKVSELSVEKRIGKENYSLLFLEGSSLTDSWPMAKGMSWPERLNDMCDINIMNNGVSGNNTKDNIKSLMNRNSLVAFSGYNNTKGLIFADCKPNYILWLNSANGTEVGADGLATLENAKAVTDSYGAKMIIGSEEAFTDIYADYDRTFITFAEKHGLPCTAMGSIYRKLYPNTIPYTGFRRANHAGFRLQAPYHIHYDVIGRLPVNYNVKLFKVRPLYKGGNPSVNDLVYDTNSQRLRYFTAISCGATDAYGTAFLDNVDDINQKGTNAPSEGNDNTGNSNNEVALLLTGQDISFNKWALCEFILPNVRISSGKFKVRCSVQPTNIYVAVGERGSETIDNSPRSTWVELKATYTNGVLSASIPLRATNIGTHLTGHKLKDIQLGDKVRFLLYYKDGDLTLANPEFYNYDGDRKIQETLEYHRRRYGKELNTEGNGTALTNGDGTLSDWNLNGNVSVQSFPPEIAVYTNYNMSKGHLEFDDNTGIASKTIKIEKPCQKIAVRIICQSFKKICTTRSFSKMTNEQKDKYISTTVDYHTYEYDYGTIRITINGTNVHEKLVMQGWNEVYFETELLPEDDMVKIELQRNNWIDDKENMPNSDNPLLVHDVSVQKIF